MIARCLRHRAPGLWVLLPFMAGILAGKILPRPPPSPALLGAALFAATLAAIAAWKNHVATWAGALIAAMLFAGAAAYMSQRARLAAWDALPPREARLILKIERLFPGAMDEKTVRGLARVTFAEPHLRDLRGQRVYFSLRNPVAVEAGALTRSTEIAAVGVLAPLKSAPSPGSFAGFLDAAGVNFEFTRGRALAITGAAGAYAQFRERMLARFGAQLTRGLERRPELAGVLRAMLLGEKHELSDAQQTQFLQSGTMHLFAISGLHIAAIAVALHAVLAALRLPRVMRFIGTLTALWLYVDITGASPSAVRAFLMIALVETAWALRRPANPAAALAFAALATLVVDPRQLFSASFQMSYGIVAAIVLLGLPLAETWQERAAVFRDLPKATWSWPQRTLEWLWRKTLAALALGFSTTLVSLVCGVLFFGLFTPGGLVANLVLIPVSSLVIFGGFASLLLGLAGLGAVGAHFNLAAALTLRGMELAVAGLLQAPGFFLEMEFRASWVGFAALGVMMAAIFAGYATRWEKRFGGFWTPFALTALALVLATKLR